MLLPHRCHGSDVAATSIWHHRLCEMVEVVIIDCSLLAGDLLIARSVFSHFEACIGACIFPRAKQVGIRAHGVDLFVCISKTFS